MVVSPTSDNTGVSSISLNPEVTGGSGAITATVPFDTRQLSLQDYTDTGSSATDHISQDNSYTLSLDNAAHGTTPHYQISIDNGDNWSDTSAVQNSVPDGHYLYRAVVNDIHDMPLYSNSIDLTVDTTKPDLISIDSTDGQTASGEAEAGTTVNLFSGDGQTVFGTTVADSNNHWSISGLDIADGTTIKATATDIAGNVSNEVTTQVEAKPLSMMSLYSVVNNDDNSSHYFESGSGNDSFHMTTDGHDTLMYKLLDNSDNTGGNGSDTVNNFHLGNVTTDSNADIINIKDLLADYQGTANAYYDVTENKFVMDKASSGLDQFVSTSVHNGNTTISVDRDGANGNHQMTALVTLDNTQTDLATLIGNHQLIIA